MKKIMLKVREEIVVNYGNFHIELNFWSTVSGGVTIGASVPYRGWLGLGLCRENARYFN